MEIIKYNQNRTTFPDMVPCTLCRTLWNETSGVGKNHHFLKGSLGDLLGCRFQGELLGGVGQITVDEIIIWRCYKALNQWPCSFLWKLYCHWLKCLLVIIAPATESLSPWASYQIRKIAVCACAGNAGNVFPHRRFRRKPLVSDPSMHHGTCVTHVPWCMSGSLTCGGGENVPGIPGACAPAILRIWQEAHEPWPESKPL